MRIVTNTLFLCSSLIISTTALTADPLSSDCRRHVTSTSSISFDNQKHRLWWNRFWTGRCGNLDFLSGCFSSSNSAWNDVVRKLVRRARPGEEARVREGGCQLGALIGHEWAKENNIRCIHTTGANSLSKLRPMLDRKGDPVARIKATRAAALRMCSKLRLP